MIMCANISEPFTYPAYHAFRVKNFNKTGTKTREKTQKKEKEEKDKAIRCKNCGKKITGSKDRIEMHGRHTHVFNNPAGYVYEIGCFASAGGCVNSGTPTMEFTWFHGFAWRFAMCSGCLSHLGWLFQSPGGNSFYGLILDYLFED